MPCGNRADYWAAGAPVWYRLWPVKTALLIPLAFLAGAHGFALFAPYLALFLAFLATAQLVRRRRLAWVMRRAGHASETPTLEM